MDLLDRPLEPVLRDYAALVADLAGTPIGLVSLIDTDRQWLAGRFGLELSETPRSISFCAHAIQRPGDVFWIEDAAEDERFRANPLVLGPPHIRFYAGAPILVESQAVGALCAIGPDPRGFDARLARQLHGMAALLSERFEKRRRDRQLLLALEATSDAIITCDEHGRINGWRRGATALFGYTDVEALGASISLLAPPGLRARHEAGMKRWREQDDVRLNTRMELPAVRKDGVQIEIELCISLTERGGETLITNSIRDITDRKQQAAALERAKLEAEAANKAKSAFLAKMSHELRTPLNGVIGVLDMLGDSPLSSRQIELVSIAEQSSKQLERILGDVLDLARIESGQIMLATEPVVLSEVVEAALDITALRASEKGLQLYAEIAPSIPNRVFADPGRLKQILINLLTNAVKFTDVGAVSLQVSTAGTHCRFEIRDSGIGIDAEKQALIFEPFRQADDSIERRFAGTGLGLAICRDLVEAMGGAIGCSSEPGAGSLFWFEIALPAADEADLEPAAPPVDTPDVPMAGLRVLLADDNATNRRVVELMLGAVGAEITAVEDGAEALNAYRTGSFDLVLMDMMMPVMDGLSAVQVIREQEVEASAPSTPIIMLTANAMPEHVAAAQAAGANLHLSKPVTAASLFAAISALGSADTQSDDAEACARALASR
ncbi:MAG: ATP-binding protein [Phenylobacterium sp.]|nr:ATP-binding protein [Phenylobacterium sp.]